MALTLIMPMPRLPDGRAPTISDGWGSDRDGGARRHLGVDIMYRRPKCLPEGVRLPLPDHGSRCYEVPRGTVNVAAAAGRVWSTRHTSLGWRVVIDHGPEPVATVYQHGERLLIPEHRDGRMLGGGDPLHVERGAPIHTCGHSLADGAQIRHLHFELLLNGVHVDPAPYLRGAPIIDRPTGGARITPEQLVAGLLAGLVLSRAS